MSSAIGFISMYSYASIPLITCNILFYSIISLSNSITSTQNVFRFIYEHKDSDYLIYKCELKNIDLLHKMKIIYELIFDTIQKYIPEKDKYNKFLEYIEKNKNSSDIIIEDNDNYDLINLDNDTDIISNFDKPILYAIISLSETLQNINIIMNKINNKIIEYEKIYFKKFTIFTLKNELSHLKFYCNVLDIRYRIFIDLLKIYLPFNKKLF
jgi:hypothetical protein